MLVELEHPRHRALEEGAVVAHDDDAAREFVEERLESFEPGEVEVVGRLVEQEHVEPAEQDRGERGACGLPARQRRASTRRAGAPAGRGRHTRPAARASRSGPPAAR